VYLLAVTNTRLEIGLSDAVEEAADRLVQQILSDLQVFVSKPS
jgi:Ni,Fe-hydrogenase maturation factor